MDRNWISRSLAGMLALWLAVCLAEPVQLHTCAMHGGLALGQAPSQATHAHDSGAGHLSKHAGAGHFHRGQSGDGQSRQCSCLGDCSAGSSPVGITAGAISLIAASTIEAPAAESAYASPRITPAHFLLPFSNGPPADPSRA